MIHTLYTNSVSLYTVVSCLLNLRILLDNVKGLGGVMDNRGMDNRGITSRTPVLVGDWEFDVSGTWPDSDVVRVVLHIDDGTGRVDVSQEGGKPWVQLVAPV